MKGFVGGALSALLVGVLLLFASDWYASWKKDGAQLIAYNASVGEIYLSEKDIQRLATWKYGDTIRIMKIENRGLEELDNLIIEIESVSGGATGPIYDAEILSSGGQSAIPPTMKISGGKLTLAYPLMRPQDSTTFWIRSRFSSSLRVQTARKGLTVEEVYGPSRESAIELSDFLFVGGIAFVFFILGAVAAELINRSVLRKVGFDPDEIAKLYAAEIAKKK